MLSRYSSPEMAKVWSVENKTDKWLEVEIAACEAWARLGQIPSEELEKIRGARYDLERMAAIEAETHHDVTAFLRSVAESLGEESRYIHLGLTSSDVVDTGLALQVEESAAILAGDIAQLTEVLATLAVRYKYTVMVGRTHGVHAEPITFGFKLAVWYDEMRRHAQRLEEARRQMAVGKISGPVGTHDSVPPAVEEYVCQKLGLQPAKVSTQVVQRDRHAHFVTTLAIIASSLDKMATEIRALQRTEVREVEQPFASGQHGSSSMPHKRNPELCERVCGLARVIRGYAVTALENVALWHERDISHSSAERIILPEACTYLDYILRLMVRILSGLRVYPERMRRNLELTKGLVFSQRVLLALIEKGMGRQEAYQVVQRNALRAWETEADFFDLLREDPEVGRYLSRDELLGLRDYSYYLKHIDTAYQRLGLTTAAGPPGRAGKGEEVGQG